MKAEKDIHEIKEHYRSLDDLRIARIAQKEARGLREERSEQIIEGFIEENIGAITLGNEDVEVIQELLWPTKNGLRKN